MPQLDRSKQIPKKAAARRKLNLTSSRPFPNPKKKTITSTLSNQVREQSSTTCLRMNAANEEEVNENEPFYDTDSSAELDLHTTSYVFKSQTPSTTSDAASGKASNPKTAENNKAGGSTSTIVAKKQSRKQKKVVGAKRSLAMPKPKLTTSSGIDDRNSREDGSMSEESVEDSLSRPQRSDDEAATTVSTTTEVTTTETTSKSSRTKKGHANGNTHFHSYLLRSLDPKHKNKTYIGYTTQPHRRIRQHNGELKGSGASKTKRAGRPWEFVLIVYGFPDAKTALQFEWHWQHPGKSLSVRGATENDDEARKLGRRYHVAGKLDILCILLTQVDAFKDLPLQIFFSKDDDRQMFLKSLQKQNSLAELPAQMKLDVCSVEEMPYYVEMQNNRKRGKSKSKKKLEESHEIDEYDNETSWMANFKSLCDFQNSLNHDGGNSADRSSLDKWIALQIEQYRLLREGKKSTMNEDRIEALESLGFSWEDGAIAELSSSQSDNPRLPNAVQCSQQSAIASRVSSTSPSCDFSTQEHSQAINKYCSDDESHESNCYRYEEQSVGSEGSSSCQKQTLDEGFDNQNRDLVSFLGTPDRDSENKKRANSSSKRQTPQMSPMEETLVPTPKNKGIMYEETTYLCDDSVDHLSHMLTPPLAERLESKLNALPGDKLISVPVVRDSGLSFSADSENEKSPLSTFNTNDRHKHATRSGNDKKTSGPVSRRTQTTTILNDNDSSSDDDSFHRLIMSPAAISRTVTNTSTDGSDKPPSHTKDTNANEALTPSERSVIDLCKSTIGKESASLYARQQRQQQTMNVSLIDLSCDSD